VDPVKAYIPFGVGVACSGLQMSLIYALSFLSSATAPAYVATMMAWFLGGACGCWLPNGVKSAWVFAAAALLHALNTGLLSQGTYWGSCTLAAGAGGLAGACWLCHQGRQNLPRLLFFESLGMATGFLLTSVLIYPLGLALLWAVPPGVILLTMRED
jgi:hypothetical protein